MSSVLRNDDLTDPRRVDPGFKALVLDIETGPNLAYCWGMFDQNIGLHGLIDPGTVLCFAAKWLGDPKSKTHFYSDHHDGHEVMLEAIWKLVDEADAVIHYNGRAFDMKHLSREWLLAGFQPPSPYKDIDLLTAARSRFKFQSNKLDFVAQQLGVGQKVKHEGFDLWKACLDGDAAAWGRMKKYNVGDITITEEVYYKLRPWIKSHPHVGNYSGEENSCPNCGGTELQRRGFYMTPSVRYQRLRCNGCGTWSRARTKDKVAVSPDTRGVT